MDVRRLLPALALVAALAFPALAQAVTGPPYRVGTAKVDITPPPASDAAVAPAGFSSPQCAGMGGPRKWAFDEPYIDADGSGDFNYQRDLSPEPYCDANQNGRYDAIYSSGAVATPATEVHDPIDARAIALSDGAHTVVIVSVVAQGIFENYLDEARAQAQALEPEIDDVVISANHNESSPDTVGIYGAPPAPEDVPVLGGAVGLTSGIDEYYMDWLDSQIAAASVQAFDDRQPASLWVRDFPMPDGLQVDLSHNFPTTDDDRNPAAIDPKVRVLQARDEGGDPIVTVMNLAAHNQEIGHSDNYPGQISADWPGYFHDRLERDVPGMAMFLVGDNGSEEDPETVPPVSQAEHAECDDGCYAQAQATGEAFADAVAAQTPQAEEIRGGPVSSRRDVFYPPLENNLFKAAAAAGLFGERQTYVEGPPGTYTPAGRAGNLLKTSVAVVDVGPDLQFLANPGEAFPALMLGSPWGIEDVGCPERPNPPVPTWHAAAANRFQIGLADDMIGYEIPAWAFSSLPGAFDYYGPPDNGGPATCVNDFNDRDPQGHQHKLETEGAGPTASNMLAEHLTALLDAAPDPVADIHSGRFLYADGTTSHRAQRPDGNGGTEDAVAIWFADPGQASLGPTDGTIVALEDIGAFGDRPVDASGQFMDYDGQPQDAADITTRGMLRGPGADPAARHYLNVYPALDTADLGAARRYCDDTTAPSSQPSPEEPRVRDERIALTGSASDEGCPAGADTVARDGEVRSVEVAVSKRLGDGVCRYLQADGTLGPEVTCKPQTFLAAKGTEKWRLRQDLASPLPAGRYRARSRATDAAGNAERHTAADALRFHISP